MGLPSQIINQSAIEALHRPAGHLQTDWERVPDAAHDDHQWRCTQSTHLCCAARALSSAAAALACLDDLAIRRPSVCRAMSSRVCRVRRARTFRSCLAALARAVAALMAFASITLQAMRWTCDVDTHGDR